VADRTPFTVRSLLALCLPLLGVACTAAPPSPPVHPVTEYPEIAGKRAVYRQEFSPPRPAPDFQLTDMTGHRLGLGDLAGKIVVLGFIYTRCPDVCPLFAHNFLTLQRELGESIGRQVALVFITTDPEGDTPQRAQQYTRSLGGRWHFLTGSRAEVASVWEAYEVKVVVNPQGVVEHSYKTYLIDQQGRLRFLYGGLYDPQELAADVQGLLPSAERGAP